MTESMRKYIRGGLTAAFSVAALPLAAAGAQAADLRCGIDPHRATVGARHPEGREFRRGLLTVTNNGSAPDRLAPEPTPPRNARFTQ